MGSARNAAWPPEIELPLNKEGRQHPMKLLSRMFRPRPAPREALRPLWHRIVEIAREEEWYAESGVADTVGGRFDMITAVLSMVVLRMEREPILVGPSALLTELFVEDMDGQLREIGVGDLVVGKHIGRLMSVFGGRLGAYRDGLAGDDAALAETVARNVSLIEGHGPERPAKGLAQLSARLSGLEAEALLDGIIPR